MISSRFETYSTGPIPPETAAENALRTFTLGSNHFINLSSPPTTRKQLEFSNLILKDRKDGTILVESQDCSWEPSRFSSSAFGVNSGQLEDSLKRGMFGCGWRLCRERRL